MLPLAVGCPECVGMRNMFYSCSHGCHRLPQPSGKCFNESGTTAQGAWQSLGLLHVKMAPQEHGEGLDWGREAVWATLGLDLHLWSYGLCSGFASFPGLCSHSMAPALTNNHKQK